MGESCFQISSLFYYTYDLRPEPLSMASPILCLARPGPAPSAAGVPPKYPQSSSCLLLLPHSLSDAWQKLRLSFTSESVCPRAVAYM